MAPRLERIGSDKSFFYETLESRRGPRLPTAEPFRRTTRANLCIQNSFAQELNRCLMQAFRDAHANRPYLTLPRREGNGLTQECLLVPGMPIRGSSAVQHRLPLEILKSAPGASAP